MADVPPNVRRLIAQIVAHKSEFIFTAGTPLDREAFSATVQAKMDQFRRRDSSINPSDLVALRAFLNGHFGRITSPIDSAKFLEFLEQANRGTVPDDMTAFLGAPPVLSSSGSIWDNIVGGFRKVSAWVGETWDKGMQNDTFKLFAGNGIAALAGLAMGWVGMEMTRSIGPNVPYLSTAFALPVAISLGLATFFAVRGNFPSNEVAAERERGRRAEGPARIRTGALEEPEVERAVEVGSVTAARLAAVVDKPVGVRVVREDDPAGVVLPVLPAGSSVIMRG